jgi:hypothetical protein
MVKAGRPSEPKRRTRKPSWISDKENQRKWNDRFRSILKRNYLDSDIVISAIFSRGRLAELCATRIRSYVDTGVTLSLNAQTKAAAIKQKKQLQTAIAGLHAAIGLLKNRPDQQSELNLGELADEFSRQLVRCKQAFGTKRRGRDRDHSILYECRSFLQSNLNRPITNKTLANLVNAGYEADGILLKDHPITEEHIRKNLANFKRNNRLSCSLIDSRYRQLVKEPETK